MNKINKEIDEILSLIFDDNRRGVFETVIDKSFSKEAISRFKSIGYTVKLSGSDYIISL